MPMTTGTNTPEILSASFAMGALLELASSTRPDDLGQRGIPRPPWWHGT